MERHLVCEPCGPNVAGGYDPSTQQVRLQHFNHNTGQDIFVRLCSVKTTFTLKVTWQTHSHMNSFIVTTTAVHMWTGVMINISLAQKYVQQVSVESASFGKKILRG